MIASYAQKHRLILQVIMMQIHALRRIRNFLPEVDAEAVAIATVSSRLDHCNSLLHGTSASNMNKLQRVQNHLARLIACANQSRLQLTGCLQRNLASFINWCVTSDTTELPAVNSPSCLWRVRVLTTITCDLSAFSDNSY